jgi:prepilin-type processing-associated H-X9-DG protein
VSNPSGKIMLAEEPGSVAGWDSPGGDIIKNGRWVPGTLTGWDPPDLLTVRHGGKGDVTFADGHVLAEAPAFGFDTNNNLAMQ